MQEVIHTLLHARATNALMVRKAHHVCHESTLGIVSDGCLFEHHTAKVYVGFNSADQFPRGIHHHIISPLEPLELMAGNIFLQPHILARRIRKLFLQFAFRQVKFLREIFANGGGVPMIGNE